MVCFMRDCRDASGVVLTDAVQVSAMRDLFSNYCHGSSQHGEP